MDQAIDPKIKSLVSSIKQAESGGSKDPYSLKGASGEHGAYQFMPETWDKWSQQYLGKGMSHPMTVENQNKVAYNKVKDLKDQGYNPAQIASIWNSGHPDWEGRVGVNKFGVHYDTPSYVKKVSDSYHRFKQAPPKQFVDTSQSSAQPVSQSQYLQNIEQSQTQGGGGIGSSILRGLEGAGKAIGEFGEGVAQSAATLPSRAAELGSRIGGSLGAMVQGKTLQEYLAEQPDKITSAIQTTRPDILTPKTPAQQLGAKAEKVGEFFLPGVGESAGAGFIPKAVSSGLQMAGTSAIQGGSPQEIATSGAIGGAGSLIGSGANALLRRIGSKVSEPLMSSAVKDYAKAFSPIKSTQKMVGKSVPGLLKRRVGAFSLSGLSEKAATKVDSASEAIDKELELVPEGTKVNPQNVHYKLEELKNNYIVDGVPIEPGKINTINAIQKTIADVGQAPSFKSMRKVRQILDRSVAEGGGYFGKTLKEGAVLDTKREAANAIREVLAKENPDLNALNAEFSFWKNVQDVTKATIDRRSGRGPSLSETIAQGAGTAGELARGGGIPGSAITGKVFQLLTSFVRSPGWKITGAIQKARLADLLSSGDITGVQNLITKLTVAGRSKKR